jgi:hypothetical protein
MIDMLTSTEAEGEGARLEVPVDTRLLGLPLRWELLSSHSKLIEAEL